MSNVYTSLLKEMNPETFPGYKYTLYDRIINVKIKRGRVTDGKVVYDPSLDIVIRSDYEMIMNEGVYEIRRCSVKPSISVTYKQVCNAGSVDFKVRIANFHQYTLEGESKSANYNDEFKIISVEVHMGYISQFPDILDPYFKGNVLDTYYNFLGEKGTRVLEGKILDAYTEKPTPDTYFVLHCAYVKTDTSEDSEYTEEMAITTNKTLSEVLFENVTMRFTKDIVNEDFSVSPVTPTVANKEGIKCFVSAECEEEWQKLIAKQLVDPSTGEVKNLTVKLGGSRNPTTYLYKLKETVFPSLRFTLTQRNNEYCIFVYSSVERNTGNKKYYYRSSVYDDSDFEFNLAAIYSVELSATPIVSCPFFPEVNALNNVAVPSRYASTNLVSYYYRPQFLKEGTMYFEVINIAVSFSTVEKDNEMKMTCTYISKGDK